MKADAYSNCPSWHGPGNHHRAAKAGRYMAESERIHRALHNQSGLAFAVLTQANVTFWQGDAIRATPRFDEAERLARNWATIACSAAWPSAACFSI